MIRWYGDTMVQDTPQGLKTHLPDGKVVYAHPNDDEESRRMALELGYGSDLMAMTLDHDRYHVAIAHAIGLYESPALRAVQRGECGSALANLEEALVLSAQRFANACREAGLL